MVSGENVSKAASSGGLFFVPENQAIGEIENFANRLVKGSKSPTHQKCSIESKIFQNLALARCPTVTKFIQETPVAKNTTGSGAFTIVENREYSGEYRVRTQVESSIKQSPPDNVGDRVTAMLTNNGARKIAESCEFMDIKRGGYSTFLTLTLDSDARKRITQKEIIKAEYIEAENVEKPPEVFQEIKEHRKTEFMGAHTPILDGPFCPISYKNKSTIQKEVSRFFDGLQKMYQRGFEYEKDETLHKVEGSKVVSGKSERLDYLWVAECPDSIDKSTGEVGDVNPHVHVLMRYRVPFVAFDAWSKRVESLWGQGFAHLEKIKDGSKAGSYMAKAAGYLCKAQGKSDQGVITGNRYNISRSARAPAWVCVGRYQLGRMGFLISEAAENFENNYGHLKKQRDFLKKRHSETSGKERHKIGEILENKRAVIKNLPRFSKYQAILKGEYQFNEFMRWAANDAPESNHAWLPDKAENESFLTDVGRGQWIQEYTTRRGLRRVFRRWSSWFDDMKAMNEYLFNGEILRPCFENDYIFNECQNDDLSDYNEWSKTEGLIYD